MMNIHNGLFGLLLVAILFAVGCDDKPKTKIVVRHAPVIQEGPSVAVTCDEDNSPVPFSLTLNASDADGDTLTWSILTQAANGAAAVSGIGTTKPIAYTPDAGWSGVDGFVVQVSDGKLTDTVTVTVTVTVRAEPRPPQSPLHLANKLSYPTRICPHPDGGYLVSDAKVGSVFVLDSEMTPTGQFKRCGTPLGVAVDANGRVYVGDNNRDGILVFSATGRMIKTWGRGQIKMPNDMAFHHDGRLFVVDSKCDDIKIFDPSGKLLKSFGHSVDGWDGFNFPNSIAMSPVTVVNSETLATNVYISDFMNSRIAVFTDQGEFVKVLDGNPTFSFGSMAMGMGMFGSPNFSKIQAMEFDTEGVLHVLDCYQHKISRLDINSDTVLSTYGAYGDAIGQLRVPLDLTLEPTGSALVTNSIVGRIDRVDP